MLENDASGRSPDVESTADTVWVTAVKNRIATRSPACSNISLELPVEICVEKVDAGTWTVIPGCAPGDP